MGRILSDSLSEGPLEVEGPVQSLGDPCYSFTDSMSPRRWVWVVATVATVGGVSALVILSYLPVPRSFTMHDVGVYDLETTCSGILTIKGTSVTFQWWAPRSIEFGAWSCSANHIVYEANGTNGSGTIVSIGGAYEFGTICAPGPSCVLANVSGTYTGPWLEW